MAEKSTKKNLKEWAYKILLTIILIGMACCAAYDNNPWFALIFAFIAGCKMPEYIRFTKQTLGLLLTHNPEPKTPK